MSPDNRGSTVVTSSCTEKYLLLKTNFVKWSPRVIYIARQASL